MPARRSLLAAAMLPPGLLLAMLCLASQASAHALLYEVVEGEAVVVHLYFPGADKPWFEPYEVHAPGLEYPFQTGRINARGELSFRPDRSGQWRVRVFTEDGHGVVIDIEVDETRVVTAARGQAAHAHDYWLRVLAGLGALILVFGAWILWRRRHAQSGQSGGGAG